MATSVDRRRGRRLALAAGAVLLALLSFAGCGGGSPPSQRVISIADGEQSVVIDGDGENQVALTDDLPTGFPGDVPVVDGSVIQGSTITSGESMGWTVAILRGGGVADAVDRVAADLIGAGLTETNRFVADEGAVLGYAGDAYVVQAALSPQENDTLVSYTVARSGPTP